MPLAILARRRRYVYRLPGARRMADCCGGRCSARASSKAEQSAGSTSETILDPAQSEPDGFWTGYKLRLLDERDRTIAESPVVGLIGRVAALILDLGLSIVGLQRHSRLTAHRCHL